MLVDDVATIVLDVLDEPLEVASIEGGGTPKATEQAVPHAKLGVRELKDSLARAAPTPLV